ncbi:hypothetical protein BDB00DRAFT_379071 [Zychaea mexicana]|uniref:uncharacterized protein n=1 Tax=Zychaea mexicana TaxID=64656 RepID=UPI0022FF1C4B|nr:uncharacterized protein BDB00DRAFT_379071 [Zychaea mexicana]KAI9493392.1 hypothetical protein BDB00DRAFT_379071 [Zychaea mexicana]
MSGVIPIAYIPPSRQSSEHVYNRPANTIEEQQQQYDNAVAQTSYPRYNKFLSQSFRKSDLQRQSTATALTAADDNPFSDDHHSRNSVLTTDDERASIASSVAHVTKTPVKATQAYQMQRAKPQIMRVNTVRVNNGAGLTRSGSTRTVLTRDSTQLSRSNTAPTRHQQQQQQTEKQQQNPGEENGQQQHVPVQLADVEQRPSSAPAAQLNDEDDPFHDRHSATNASSASSSSEKLRPQITDSMVSGPSDGEITIFWDAHRSTQSLSPASFPKPPQSP